MSTAIASWNLGRALDNDKQIPLVLEGIDRLNADLIILPEAYSKAAAGVEDFASSLGYTALAVEYDDTDGRDYLQHLVVATRLPTRTKLSPTRAGSRNAIRFSVDDPSDSAMVEGVGIHFEDRTEALRQSMADALIADDLSVIMGDFNSMHAGDFKARLLRSALVRGAVRAIPGEMHKKLGRIKSLGTRLTEMADGGTLRMLIEAGLIDADEKHKSTMLFGGVAFGQLDHLLHTPDVQVKDFAVTKLKGSDHKAISATVSRAA